jgi:hypothetical protein
MNTDMKKLITATVLLTVLGFASASTAFAQTSPSTSSVKQYNQAVASWTLVPGAKCYNIYYRRVKQTGWKHSVRCLSNNTWNYTVKGLVQGVSYEYSVAALSYSGKEYAWTPVKPFVTTPVTQ